MAASGAWLGIQFVKGCAGLAIVRQWRRHSLECELSGNSVGRSVGGATWNAFFIVTYIGCYRSVKSAAPIGIRFAWKSIRLPVFGGAVCDDICLKFIKVAIVSQRRRHRMECDLYRNAIGCYRFAVSAAPLGMRFV